MSQFPAEVQPNESARFQAAVARWSANPVLAPVAAPAGMILLVLDADASRILGGSDEAAGIRSAISDGQGHVNGSVRLGLQIRRLGPLSERPRLVRLRLDSRGIAPASTCLIARTTFDDGETALLIAPMGQKTGSRQKDAAGRDPIPSQEPVGQMEPGDPAVAARLVWRSDADGVITHASGAGSDIATTLLGQSWQALCSGDADAGLLDALAARRTFRAVPVTIRLSGSRNEAEIAVSGVPSARSSNPFAGYAGFGVVTSRGPSRSPHTDPVVGAGPTVRAVGDVSNADIVPVSGNDNATSSAAGVHPQHDLSTNEHAAFQEIAQALGVRFAPDHGDGLDQAEAPGIASSVSGDDPVETPAALAPAQASGPAEPSERPILTDRVPPPEEPPPDPVAAPIETQTVATDVGLEAGRLRERVTRLLSGEPPAARATARGQPNGPRLQTDHTERHPRSEAILRQKLDFLAMAARGIRSPIAEVLSATDAMLVQQGGADEDEAAWKRLYEIRASGDRALARLDDLIQLASLESGQCELAFADIPLNTLISSCIAQMQPQAARDRIVVRTSLAPDLTTVLADERSLRQAALGAIANALRATEPGGQVIVSTTLAERGEIALRVRDTGAGMTAEEIATALEPYRQRLPRARTIEVDGLGLILTKALVEANRGALRLTSKKDEGTLVEMVFPPRALRA